MVHSAFFSRAKTASTLGMIIFFGSFFPMFSLDDKNTNGELLAATLSPTIGFGGGINLLATYENDGVGMTFDTVSLIPNNYSFENVLWMLCADFFILTVLGWYFYEVGAWQLRGAHGKVAFTIVALNSGAAI